MQIKSLSVTLKPYSFFPCQVGDERPVAVRTRCCIGEHEWEWAETLDMTTSGDEIDVLMNHLKEQVKEAIGRVNAKVAP